MPIEVELLILYRAMEDVDRGAENRLVHSYITVLVKSDGMTERFENSASGDEDATNGHYIEWVSFKLRHEFEHFKQSTFCFY